jgi:SAM-dependent MidA family methyltransferase
MEDALYDPEHGFFSTSPVGRAFATAPHISPVFASCVARLLARTRDEIGGGPVSMLEVACGDGSLAAQVARSAPRLAMETRYVGVDRDPGALTRFRRRADLGFANVTVAASLEGVAPIRGLIFANELFDNVPFHRLRGRDGRVVEVLVERSNTGWVEVEADPIPSALSAASRVPRDGEERPSSPAARELFGQMARRLDAGALVVIDYGFTDEEEAEPVRGYRGHARVDPLVEPLGSCDITGPVDIGALVSVAQAEGLEVERTTQRKLLFQLGYEEFLDDLSRQRAAAERAEDHRLATRLWSARRDASMLIDPAHLGAFHVLLMRR